ncbi:hypothetical protein BaRGS_00013831 [Batillaria attramentaria]|uniref:Uncharacterized protein n=1 Tax=Batillaria attramentaria TaxID=370345 RepID=A0ABD0L716_9CAEN
MSLLCPTLIPTLHPKRSADSRWPYPMVERCVNIHSLSERFASNEGPVTFNYAHWPTRRAIKAGTRVIEYLVHSVLNEYRVRDVSHAAAGSMADEWPGKVR